MTGPSVSGWNSMSNTKFPLAGMVTVCLQEKAASFVDLIVSLIGVGSSLEMVTLFVMDWPISHVAKLMRHLLTEKPPLSVYFGRVLIDECEPERSDKE